MKRSIVFPCAHLLALVLLSAEAAAGTPAHLWSQSFGSTGWDGGNCVAVDASGNIFVTGYFGGTVDFGGGNLVSAGSYDIFLVKCDAAGVYQRSQRFGGTGDDRCYSVAVDASGNVFLTGYFQSTVDFGGGALNAGPTADIFVAKYSAAGVHQWSQRFGSPGFDYGTSVAVDASGNVLVTGFFGGTVDFGGGNLVSGGGLWDIFVAKYDAAGVHQWSKRFGSTDDDFGYSVAVDALGNVFVTGLFQGTVDFGGGNLVSEGGNDMFLSKYDPTGVHQWSKRFGSPGFDSGSSAAVDVSGNVFVTGGFEGSVDFGGGDLVSAGSSDLFVAKYDAAGVHKWSKRFGSVGKDLGYSVAVDGWGNVVATGYFGGTVDFGGGNLTSADTRDIFLVKYDAAGVHQWSQGFGGPDLDYGRSVAVDAWGSVFLTGDFRGSVDFGGGNLVFAGDSDIFIAKYGDENGNPVLISRFDAIAHFGSVDVTWELRSDEALEGFTLYRGCDESLLVVIATGDAQTAYSYTDASVEPGRTYQYELMIRTVNGDEFRSPMATVTMPSGVTTLAQNHPNPFNPQTTIEYTVSNLASVSIDIFDASGALVRRLDQGVREAGSYSAEWDGRDAANRSVGSGVYFYRLAGVKSAETRKMVLVK